MAETTGIAWTEATWNPWRGCTKVSPGCKNCYMFTEQKRYGRDPAEVVRTKTWGDPPRWQKKAAAEGRTVLVFTCSWSDWFHADADPWREEAWAVVRRCPNLVFQVLTKRADRIAGHLPADWGAGYPNVWLGVSVEDQARADERIPLLLQVPAAVRFLSCEPLLGSVNLEPFLQYEPFHEHYKMTFGPTEWRGVDWVIVGGESGHGARPMHIDWARSLRDQCQAAGVPYFFKQWGEWATGDQSHEQRLGVQAIHAGDRHDMVAFVGKDRESMFRVGKKAAGHLLDGREWHELPAPTPPTG